MECMASRLIEQTEHPERNTMGSAYLNVIDSQIAVWCVLYLVKGLATASNLKGDGVIGNEIASAGKRQGMGGLQLIDKERFPDSAYLGVCRHGIEQVGILHIEFLWFSKLAETVLLVVEQIE